MIPQLLDGRSNPRDYDPPQVGYGRVHGAHDGNGTGTYGDSGGGGRTPGIAYSLFGAAKNTRLLLQVDETFDSTLINVLVRAEAA